MIAVEIAAITQFRDGVAQGDSEVPVDAGVTVGDQGLSGEEGDLAIAG